MRPNEQEPPIREFADRGTKWLLDLPENLRGLLRLVEADLADSIDFERAERIDRSFIPDDLKKLEADVVYRAPFRNGRGWVWIYLLLEHQSKPDRMMGFRLLCYMVKLWQAQMREFEVEEVPDSRRKLSPVIPIVLYTGKRKWSHAISLDAIMEAPSDLKAFIPSWETLFIDLNQTPPERLLDLGEAVLLALRALQSVEEPRERLAAVLRQVATKLDELPAIAKPAIKKALIYLYLLIKHKRGDEEQDELFAVMDEAVEEHTKEIEEAKLTGAEVLIRHGKVEGALEEARSLLLEIGTERLGEPDITIQEHISRLHNKRSIERLCVRLLHVETWQELLSDTKDRAARSN